MTVSSPKRLFERRGARLAAGWIGILGLGALFAWRIVHGGEAGEEEAQAIPTQAAQVTLRDGQRLVVLDSAAQARAGIVVTALPIVRFHDVARAYGGVVGRQQLGEARSRVTRAHARSRQARIEEERARKNRDRVRTLYGQGETVSLKELEAAEAEWGAAEADASAARTEERAAIGGARQRWGPLVGDWIERGAADLDPFLEGRDVLLQVTLPPGVEPGARLDTARVGTGAGPLLPARFVSRASVTDPRIQGVELFYAAPAAPGLVPGRGVIAEIPLGDEFDAVVVPRSTVVWAEGTAWVYVQLGTGEFTRRAIGTDRPTEAGYALTDLADGTRVVSGGAQVLLSEEYRSQIEVGEGGG